MLLSFAYLAFSTLLRLLVRGRRSEFTKDVELLVLRHQLGRCSVGNGRARVFGRPIAPSSRRFSGSSRPNAGRA